MDVPLRNNNPPAHRLAITPASYLVLKKDGKILMMRRAGTGYQDGCYSLPSGHLDGAEPAEAAIVREGKEEAGIDIDVKDLTFVHVLHRVAQEGGHERVDFFFAAEKWRGEPVIAEPDKCDDLQWCALDDLPEKVTDEVRVAMQGIAEGRYYTSLNF